MIRFVLLLTLAVPILGQTAQPPIVPTVGMPTELLPSKRERAIFMLNGASFNATQQPATALVQQSNGTLLQQQNPDQWLYQASINQNWSGLFWSSGDIATAVKAVGDANGSKIDKGVATVEINSGPCSVASLSTEPLKVGNPSSSTSKKLKNTAWDDAVLCLRQGRFRDRFARTLSSFSGTLTYNRIGQIINNLPIPNQNKLNQFTGEAIFTPSKLFVSADDWKNSETVAEYYGAEYKKAIVDQIFRRCQLTTNTVLAFPLGPNCVRQIAGNKGIAEKALSLLPMVDVKIQTQADFVKSGGVLVQALYPQPVLVTVKATVDLTRFIPSAKDRATAYAVIMEANKIQDARPSR